MFKKIQKKEKGFTLLESILYVAISSSLMIAIMSFMFMLLEARIKNQTIAEVEQQGLQVIQLLTQKIRNADGVTIPAQGASGTSLSFVDGGQSSVVDINNNVMFLSGVAMTNSHILVQDLEFKNLSAGSGSSVLISFTISHVNIENKQEYNFEKVFSAVANTRQ